MDFKPKEVRLAVWLLWLCVPTWLPTVIIEYDQSAAHLRNAVVVFHLLELMLYVALTICIDRGRNWARIGFLVLLVGASLGGIAAHAELAKYPPAYLILTAILFIVQWFVIYLLFTRPGALWFRWVS